MSRILFSAYACEPDKGSEPAVGWNWAVETARLGHEVWVLTRSNNRTAIEHHDLSRERNLNFLYYDLPWWVRRLKRCFGDVGVVVYYWLWQWFAMTFIRKQL